MTPYEKMMNDKRKITCTNCEYLHQEKKENTAGEINRINYCKKSGKFILEMHVNTENIFKNCFERQSEVLNGN